MARTPRPPVIAVMGHIDHGKSSLLDYIRKTNVVAGEAGGITQHVAAYIAEHNGRRVTFLDTPGHEAFKALRTRGAAAADIAILVVAADEGVMPQTLDALAAIKEASIPYVIAITKIDKNNADIERAKASLLEHGIYLEGLGGDIAYSPISSKSGQGVPELLDLVLLSADLIELSADPEARATGFVLESAQDARRGSSATLIVKEGTLRRGGCVVAGESYAPIRFIENFRGERVEEAGPSEPAVISGFSSLPSAGALFSTTETKKEAQHQTEAVGAGPTSAPEIPTEEGVAILPIVVKADVAGSLDAILHELAKITHPRAKFSIAGTGVGTVSEGDVKTAQATRGVIIAFNVETDAIARELALRESISIESFSVIYELGKRVLELLAARAPHVTLEKELGRARVIKIFSESGRRQTIGAALESGTFAIGQSAKIMRKDIDVAGLSHWLEAGRGTITNLQQARANVKEVKTEGNFGLELESKRGAAPGDELITFEAVEE